MFCILQLLILALFALALALAALNALLGLHTLGLAAARLALALEQAAHLQAAGARCTTLNFRASSIWVKIMLVDLDAKRSQHHYAVMQRRRPNPRACLLARMRDRHANARASWPRW